MQEQFQTLLRNTLTEMQGSVKGDLERVTQYAAERTAHLSTIVGEPGFDQAVIAERDNVLLEARMVAVEQADMIDRRRIEIIGGLLQIGAAALARI